MSKKTTKAAKKATTKAKAKPAKATTKASAMKADARKSPPRQESAKAKVAAKVGSAVGSTTRLVPRTTTPPKSKAALIKTDKHDRRIDGVRPSNGKAANKATGGRPVPRVTPAAGPAEPPVVMPVPKPGKNAAGLSAKELETYRELLLAKRRELVGDMYSMEREALQRSGENLSNLPMHMADMGTDNYEQEFTLGLMEKDRQLLREINAALLKIQNGMYGICEGTGKPISKARLEVQPWARYSIEHARKLESRNFVRY
jgi:RNA polymerase-binding protein DksA